MSCRSQRTEGVRLLVEISDLVKNIPLLDHLIVGEPSGEYPGFFSLAASGLVEF